ncbi:class I SAM-dependent methyltransferase [Streptomyces sp. NPDC091217]|uniref:class I SAM-dependent methyltransferase n=1 Tax=Streptomyces sp. NPDC091217 TaxID=3365975 RepID=UPI00380054AF
MTLDALETRISTHRDYSESPDDVEEAVIRELQLPVEGSLLDVGAGTGSFLARLRAAGHEGRLVGVDNSPAAVTRVEATGAAEAILADAEDLPLPDSGFDAVTARHMLYHLADPDRALREFCRVVRPGGQIVATVNHANVLPNVTSMVRQELQAVGIVPEPVSQWVSSQDLPDRMSAVADDVRVVRRDNALVFTESKPLIRFAVAILGIYGLPRDSPMRADVIRSLETRVTAWFQEGHQVWRDPKGYTVCVGRVLQ